MKITARLKTLAKSIKAIKVSKDTTTQLTIGQKVADTVAATMGSWPFIIIQSTILLTWIVLNVTHVIKPFDPYPFILLNLALSFQAAYAAPFIMMSANRQGEEDRKKAEIDYQTNTKAEMEIEVLLHRVNDLLAKLEHKK